MLVEHGEDFIAEFLIEARSLETEGRQGHLLTASPPRFLLFNLPTVSCRCLALVGPYAPIPMQMWQLAHQVQPSSPA